MTTIITKAQAELELALMQAESDSMASSDLYIWLRECGLSPEIAVRVKELVNVTQRIGNKVVSIGKLIVMKLRDFITAHKNLAIGTVLGAAIAYRCDAVARFAIGALGGTAWRDGRGHRSSTRQAS